MRHISAGALPVVSGGLSYSQPISHHVGAVLEEIGVSGDVGPSQGISRLMREQGRTFDVMVSFSDESDPTDDLNVSHGVANGDGVPSHWTMVSDSGNVARRWTVWSPRNPAIDHENSVRKFQDQLYSGEPLFSTRQAQHFRSKLRISQRWDVYPLRPIPMERPLEAVERHREVRDEVVEKCFSLLREMERVFDRKLIITSLP